MEIGDRVGTVGTSIVFTNLQINSLFVVVVVAVVGGGVVVVVVVVGGGWCVF